jgi:nicotinamidase/pyrazinamidase
VPSARHRRLPERLHPGGALAVPAATRSPAHQRARRSGDYDLVVATRDWHPPTTLVREQGGPWPVHCVAGTPGAELHPRSTRRASTSIVDKGQDAGTEGYSGFEGTDLPSCCASAASTQ